MLGVTKASRRSERRVQLVRDDHDQRQYGQPSDLHETRYEEEGQRAQHEGAGSELDSPIHESDKHPSEQDDACEEQEDHAHPA